MQLLVLAGLLALLQVFAAALAKRFQEPRGWGVSPRDLPPPNYAGVAGRLDRAAANMLETLPIFVILVIAAHFTCPGSTLALAGCQIYFWSRVAYIPAYACGVAYLRTFIYIASIVGLGVLFAALLKGSLWR